MKIAAGPTVAMTTPIKLTISPETIMKLRLDEHTPPGWRSAEAFEPSELSEAEIEETVSKKPTMKSTIPMSANCSLGLRPLTERFASKLRRFI